MDTQDRKRLIAYCGMDCAMCRSYQSGLYHLKQKGMNYTEKKGNQNPQLISMKKTMI